MPAACASCQRPISLSLAWSPLVYVGDSSTYGYAVMWTRATLKEIQADGCYHERWRFGFARLEVPSSTTHLCGSVVSPLSGFSLHAGPVTGEEGFADATVAPYGSAGVGLSTRYAESLLRSLPESESEPRLGRSAPRPAREMADVELRRAIPEVGECWSRRGRWRTWREGAWRWPEEFINVKEARASLMALDRHTSSLKTHHCRLL